MTAYKYQRLVDGIVKRIEEGEWGPDSRLPAIRVLAKENNVNNATVIAAYKYLQQTGRVYTRGGSGTYVAPAPLTEGTAVRADFINFAGSTPEADFFPAADFGRCLSVALERFGREAFVRRDLLGFWPLREVLGAGVCPERVVLFSDGLPFLKSLVKGFTVQDGTYDDFYYNRAPVERTGDVYYKNFSKILMPGLSFMVVPAGLEASLLESAHFITPPDELLCRGMDLFIRSAQYEAHTAKMRYTFNKRYQKVMDAVRIYLSDYVAYDDDGHGLGVQLHVRDGDKQKLLARLLTRGVILSPECKINFACVQEDRIHEGIGIIASQLQKVRV